MKLFCQWIIVACVVWSFFKEVHNDFEGRPAKEPMGFPGFIGTIIAIVFACWLYYAAGAWSLILP